MNNNEEKIEKQDVKKEEKPNKKDKKANKEIEKLQAEKTELNDKLLRITAEMQNMRRRYEDEISRIYRYEGESLIKKLLGIVDNFERAINMSRDNLTEEVNKFLTGIELIYKDLKQGLEEQGVLEIECLNLPFDPNSMEAVLTEQVKDLEPGIVTAVLQKGYKYNDKVIRPAMVKVNERISE